MNDLAFIYLRNADCYTIVDADLFPELNKHVWYLHPNGYARRAVVVNKIQRIIWMHRVINQTPDGMETDHRNLNRLDNRRCNLRTASHRQNQWNIWPPKSAWETRSSRYLGVTWKPGRQQWVVQMSSVGYLGAFESEEEAAKCWDRCAKERRGDFARLNFPQEEIHNDHH